MQPRLGLLARATGCVAVVEAGDTAIGHDVVRDPAFDRDRADDLAEDEPVYLDVDRIELRERRQRGRCLVDGVLTGPRPRRVRTDSPKGELRAQVADAADVELVVRRLEHDYELGLSGLRTGLQELGHRAFLSRELLADEEEKA